MHEFLNTLYATVQGSVLRLDSNTVRVVEEGKTLARFPLIRLGGIVVFGRVTVTPNLIARCAADGRGLVWMDRVGRFCRESGGASSWQCPAAAGAAPRAVPIRMRLGGSLGRSLQARSRTPAIRYSVRARDSKRADAATALRVAASDMGDALVRAANGSQS